MLTSAQQDYIDARLERWGAWSSQGANASGWASQVAWLAFLPKQSSGVPLPPNIDEEAGETDRAVCMLPGIYRDTIVAEYCVGGTKADKAKRLHISVRTFHARLETAQFLAHNELRPESRGAP